MDSPIKNIPKMIIFGRHLNLNPMRSPFLFIIVMITTFVTLNHFILIKSQFLNFRESTHYNFQIFDTNPAQIIMVCLLT